MQQTIKKLNYNDIAGGIIEGKREGSGESRGTRTCSHPERKGTSLLCHR